jgi:uncharacterized protein YgbK (DUF1537 family)
MTEPVLVALDDDPTGTQTVHDISVLTQWSVQVIASEFAKKPKGFFILTNSRALHTQEASQLLEEICRNLKAAAEEAQVDFEVVLRGDSTLRGHFPHEPLAVEKELGFKDVWVLAPFFEQGGRLTIEDVHYVKEGEKLVPCAETEFAKDAAFGYKNSNLRRWAMEKFKAAAGDDYLPFAVSEDCFRSISLDDLRKGGTNRIVEILKAIPHRTSSSSSPTILIINSVVTSDMDIFAAGLKEFISQGSQLSFLYRTAAAFVSSRLRIAPIPPLDAGQLSLSSESGGLIILGSYVPKSTAQYEYLLKSRQGKITSLTVDVESLLQSETKRREIVDEIISLASKSIQEGNDTIVASSRKLISHEDAKQSLAIGDIVSKALIDIVSGLTCRPKYVIAKVSILLFIVS